MPSEFLFKSPYSSSTNQVLLVILLEYGSLSAPMILDDSTPQVQAKPFVQKKKRISKQFDLEEMLSRPRAQSVPSVEWNDDSRVKESCIAGIYHRKKIEQIYLEERKGGRPSHVISFFLPLARECEDAKVSSHTSLYLPPVHSAHCRRHCMHGLHKSLLVQMKIRCLIALL